MANIVSELTADWLIAYDVIDADQSDCFVSEHHGNYLVWSKNNSWHTQGWGASEMQFFSHQNHTGMIVEQYCKSFWSKTDFHGNWNSNHCKY